jgi:hypothetical protein
MPLFKDVGTGRERRYLQVVVVFVATGIVGDLWLSWLEL